MKYTDIKSFEDACKDQGIDPTLLPDVSMLPSGLQKFLTAAYKLSVIAVSLNKDKGGKPTKANWNDMNEWKHHPWFDVKADKKNLSGSGLSFHGSGDVCSLARVAARLTCRTEEISDYFGENFIDLWEDYLLHRD